MAEREASTAPETASVERYVAPLTRHGMVYEQYRDERDLAAVMALIDKDLSEPYSIFTYRYFLRTWPHLAFLAYEAPQENPTGATGAPPTPEQPDRTAAASPVPVAPTDQANGVPSEPTASASGRQPLGVVVCKQDQHRGHVRGYLAMLVVDKAHRGRGMGSTLARLAIQAMVDGSCEEVVLEAEVSNFGALVLYQALGFVRDKRLHRYYLNGQDAFRLKLLLPPTAEELAAAAAAAAVQQDLAAAAALTDLSVGPIQEGHPLEGQPQGAAADPHTSSLTEGALPTPSDGLQDGSDAVADAVAAGPVVPGVAARA